MYSEKYLFATIKSACPIKKSISFEQEDILFFLRIVLAKISLG